MAAGRPTVCTMCCGFVSNITRNVLTTVAVTHKRARIQLLNAGNSDTH